MNNAFEAMNFAILVHAGQVRKYTGNPYSDHLAEVAGIVATVSGKWSNPEQLIATAWLHDSIEDQGITYSELDRKFGAAIALGVSLLSDLETGNRADRKAASRARLAAAPGWVQTIKLADLISNTRSITQHDPKFAVTYLEEKRLLLEVMRGGDLRLYKLAQILTQA